LARVKVQPSAWKPWIRAKFYHRLAGYASLTARLSTLTYKISLIRVHVWLPPVVPQTVDLHGRFRHPEIAFAFYFQKSWESSQEQRPP
jgi:hypothetical protein